MFRTNFSRDESGMLPFVSGKSRPKNQIVITAGYQFGHTVTMLISKEQAQTLIDALTEEISDELLTDRTHAC